MSFSEDAPRPAFLSMRGGRNDKPADELREEMEGYAAAGYGAVEIRISST